MTEKRFENRLNKDIKKFHALNPVWDNELKDALNVFEMIDEMNELQEEKEQLTKENRSLKLLVQNWEQLDDEKDEQLEKMNDSLKRLVEEKKKLEEEIETLHEQIAHFMEVGDVE